MLGLKELDKITVSFFGHRNIDDYKTVESKLYEIVNIIMRHGGRTVEFLVGRNGEFDQMAASVIKKLKKEISDDNIYLTLVMAYETAELKNNIESFEKYYDSIEICEASAEVSYKYAIVARNRDMIDRSDLIIFYVKNKSGGACQALQYAQKNQKRFVNLFYENESDCR